MEMFTNPYKSYREHQTKSQMSNPNLNYANSTENLNSPVSKSNRHLHMQSGTKNLDQNDHTKYFSSLHLGNMLHSTPKNNSDIKKKGFNPYARQSIKMNVLDNQLKNLSVKREEERSKLLNIINQNMFTNNQTNQANQANQTNQTNQTNQANLSNKTFDEEVPKQVNYFNPYSSNPYEEPQIGINPYNNTEITAQKSDDDEKPYVKSKFASSKKISNYSKYNDSFQSSEDDAGTPVANIKRKKKKRKNIDDLMAENAYEEIQDNIDLLKDEMTLQIRKLQRSQENLNTTDLMTELAGFREIFQDSMDRSKDRSIHEIRQLRENFKILRDDVQGKLSEETQQSKDILISMTNEVKGYQSDMSRRIAELERKQKLQLEGLKMIIENSTDVRTKILAQKFLIDDAETFEKNKTVYIKPASEELLNVVEEIKLQNKHRPRHNTEKNDAELLKLISRTKLKNKNIEEDVTVDDDISKGDKEKSTLHRALVKRVAEHIDENQEVELKKVNHFRKYVHLVIACQKLNKFKKKSSENTFISSLTSFYKQHMECDDELKIFVNDVVKVSFNSILNFENIKLDLTEHKGKTEDSEIKDKYIKLEVRLKGFFDNLIEATTKDKFPRKILNFLKFLITNNNYIPFRFFSLYEVSRLQFSQTPKNCLMSNVKEKHSAMIFCFYIILKILVKHILCEQNFVPMNKRRVISQNILKNFKTVSSIIFCDTIELYRKHCPIVNNIQDFELFCNDQTCATAVSNQDYDEKEFLKLKKNKNVSKSYIEALNKYYEKKKGGEANEVSDQEKEIFAKLNKKFALNKPDTDVNTLEYLQKILYKTSDLSNYYTLAKQNKFDLTQKIFLWVKQLIKLIKEV